MFGDLANAIQALLAPYEFAVLTHGFYRCLYFHTRKWAVVSGRCTVFRLSVNHYPLSTDNFS